MPLTLPNLDDRTYADLVEEARGLLVTYAPALTNHNPSDPLITLTEMFAYFTEVLLFRQNLITDANRTAFLRLLNGPQWQPVDPLDVEVRKAVLTARQTDRAVTAADYERLALAADPPRVMRAHCVPGLDLSIEDPVDRLRERRSHVSVVVVLALPPEPDPDKAAKARKVERDAIAANLDPRRLLGTQVNVVDPGFIPIRVRVTVRLLPDAREADVRPRITAALNKWFDRLVGGRDGTGWPFGRTVYVSEIYQLLDGIAGVDFVTRTPGDQPQSLLDELVTTATPAAIIRNAQQELVGIGLHPDELVMAQIADADIVFEDAAS
jgi:baseplate J-like protein